MYTLYIDTHFVNLVIGLFKDDQLLIEKIVESNEHSRNTIPLLEHILMEYRIDVQDLNEVIVVTGPGSFTGVRIGIVIAKMLGFTLNIPIKEITYLEAMAIHYDSSVIVGLKDRNGAFVGEFDRDHHLISDYYYLSNQELEGSNKKILFEDLVDLLEVKKFTQNKEATPPHLLKPLYVKKIEVGIW